MSQNECEHIRPDGARCQAPLQTGRSFCFFHDPEQQENRAAARRNGGFMRDHLSRQAAGQAVEAYRTTSRTDDPPLLPDNVPYLYVRTRDDITDRLEEILNRPLETPQELNRAKTQIYGLSVESSNLAAKERDQREAACSAERAAIRAERAAERAAQRAAREACTKEAIARAVERAVQQALAKAGLPPATADAGAAAADAQSRFSGTDENSPPFQRREGVEIEDSFHSAEGQRAAQQSAPKEEPIMIDASTPWDLSQFGGKKPRISCVVPLFTSMRTGKLIDVNEPNPLDPPEHMLRDEFRRKPAAPTPAAVPEGPQAAPPSSTAASFVSGDVDCPEGIRESEPGEQLSAGGAACVSPARKGWVGRKEEEPHRSAEGPRGAERSATDKTADPEPRDARPKKDPKNPYSITSLLVEQPQPPRPPDPSATPPTPPQPPKPKPGPRLHPWIEYWGLH